MYNYLIAGQKFAILELKSMITKVLKNFELELPEKDYEPVVVAELILRPEDGIRLKLKPRRKAWKFYLLKIMLWIFFYVSILLN